MHDTFHIDRFFSSLPVNSVSPEGLLREGRAAGQRPLARPLRGVEGGGDGRGGHAVVRRDVHGGVPVWVQVRGQKESQR